MPGMMGDQLDFVSRLMVDDAVDLGHVLLDKRDERRKTRCRVAAAGKLNHNSQGTYS
jgi:hypothetical protein